MNEEGIWWSNNTNHKSMQVLTRSVFAATEAGGSDDGVHRTGNEIEAREHTGPQ